MVISPFSDKTGTAVELPDAHGRVACRSARHFDGPVRDLPQYLFQCRHVHKGHTAFFDTDAADKIIAFVDQYVYQCGTESNDSPVSVM
jgi:hypothetical protein